MNKNWTANDFRNDTKESEPMEVDNIGKGKGKGTGKGKGQRAKGKGQRAKGKGQRAKGKGQRAKGKGQRAKGKGQRAKGKGTKPDNQDKECYVCGKEGHLARDCWSRTNQDRTVNEVDGAKAESDTAKEFLFAIENVVTRCRLEPKWLRS